MEVNRDAPDEAKQVEDFSIGALGAPLEVIEWFNEIHVQLFPLFWYC